MRRREKVWLEIYCEMKIHTVCNFFLPFWYMRVNIYTRERRRWTIMMKFLLLHTSQTAFVFVNTFYDCHHHFFCCLHTIIVRREFFILYFLTNAYTAINNEVKIAWMCIKCIITQTREPSMMTTTTTYMCDKKCIMAHFCVYYTRKKFTSSPVIMLAMHFFAATSSSLSLFCLPFQLCIDFYPRRWHFFPCDACMCNCKNKSLRHYIRVTMHS